MEFLVFIVALVMIAACSDAYDKYHERQMAKPQNIKDIVYA